MLPRLPKLLIIVFAVILSSTPATNASTSSAWQEPVHQLQLRADSSQPTSAASLTAEAQHRMVTSVYYDVFSWLEGDVRPDGSTVLRGQVVRLILRSDAESSVRNLQGVTEVRNEVEVLPPSPSDDQLRVALYGAIYNSDSLLFKYVMRAVPPVHIIVKGGRVTLKGGVATKMESQQAYELARGMPGVFEITNQLIVEGETVR